MPNQIIQTIYTAILTGDRPLVQTQVKQAIETGIDLASILNAGMIAVMTEVGGLTPNFFRICSDCAIGSPIAKYHF